MRALSISNSHLINSRECYATHDIHLVLPVLVTRRVPFVLYMYYRVAKYSSRRSNHQFFVLATVAAVHGSTEYTVRIPPTFIRNAKGFRSNIYFVL
jgi:hypothetical protein